MKRASKAGVAALRSAKYNAPGKKKTGVHVYAALGHGKQRATELCPLCEGAMFLEHRGRDGHAFLGCSRFPICKGTRSIDSLN